MNDHPTTDKFGSISITPEDERHDTGRGNEPPGPEVVPPGKKKPARSRRKRLSLFIFSLIIVYGLYLLAGFMLVPYLCRSYLPDQLTAIIQRPVTVEAAEFNPFSLTLTLHGGIIGPGPLLSFDTWTINFEAVSLLRQGVVCRAVQIDNLFLRIVRNNDLTYNIFKLPATGPPAADTGTAVGFFSRIPLPFSLNNIHVTNSRIAFLDVPTGKKHAMEEINLALPILSNFPYQADNYIMPRFSARINGSPVKIAGRTKIMADRIETRLNLRLTDMDVPAYLAYLPGKSGLNFTQGKMDFNLDLLFSSGKTAETRLRLEGAAIIKDLWLQDQKGKDLAKIPAVEIEGSCAPLLNSWHINKLLLGKPVFYLEKSAAGFFRLPENKSPTGNLFSGRAVQIDNFRIKDGTLTFIDRFIAGGFAGTWSDIDFSLHDFSSDRKKPADFTISGKNKNNALLAGRGEIFSTPSKIDARLTIDNLPLPHFQPYLNAAAINAAGDYRIKSGLAKIAGRLLINSSSGEDKTPRLLIKELGVHLQNLVLTKRDREWLRIPTLALQKAAVDFQDHRLNLGRMKAEDAFWLLRRNDPASERRQAKNAGGNRNRQKQPWHISLQALDLQRSDLTVEDISFPLILQLHEIALQAHDLAGHKGQINAAARLNDNGRLRLTGDISLSPFTATLEGSIEKLKLAGIKPFINSWFKREVVSGALRASGVLQLPDFSFSGEAEIDNFAAIAAGDDKKDKAVIRWRKAATRKVQLATKPLSLKIAALDIERPYLAWTILGKGKTSLDNLFAATGGDPQKEHKKPIVIGIDLIRLTGGELAFADRDISPPYAVTINNINGTASDLHNKTGNRTFYALRGTVAGRAPLVLSGEIGAFDDELFADLSVGISRLDIKPLSPYIEPHLGWEINTGTLDMVTSYKQKKGRIKAINRLDLTAFKLGKWLQGNTALPVTVAMLMDPAGHIKLDIPVNGESRNPEFSYQTDFIKVLRNLLLKTAVSPFSILGSLFKKEQPLDHLNFPYGETRLTDEVRDSLADLAIILNKRPWLTIEIRGYADAKGDREAIIAARQRLADRQRLTEAARLSSTLTSTYGREEIPPVPLPQAGSRGTIQEQRRPAFKVNYKTLLKLARNRALKIRQYLVEQLKIAPVRVSINKDEILTPAVSLGRSGNRIDFTLGHLRTQ